MTSLRSAVTTGVSWGVVSLTATRLSALATQVVLGFLLSPREWGIYAGAISITSLTASMRDGGMVDVVASRDPLGFARIARSANGLALVTNLILASGMVVLTTALAHRLGGPEVATIGALVALSLVIQTPAAVLRGLLRAQLRFRDLSLVSALAAISRALTIIACAAAGLGPVSFVAGIPLLGLIEVIVLWRIAKPGRPAPPQESEPWRQLIGPSAWLTLAAGGTALALYGDYFILGLFLTPSLLGLYYFAYQLVAQTATMIIAAMEPVLVPMLSRLKDDDRIGSAIEEVVRVLVLALGIMSVLIGVTFEHLNSLIWQDRWSDATGVVQVLSIGFALRGTASITRSLLVSHSRFKQSAVQAWALGVGLVAVVSLAGFLGLSPKGAASVVSAYLVVSSCLALTYALRHTSIRALPVIRGALTAWSMPIATGSLWFLIDQSLFADMGSLARLVVVSIGYGLTILVATRALAPGDLRQMFAALPIPTARLARVLSL